METEELYGCGMRQFVDQYTKNAFHVMSKGSNLIEVLKDFPAENSDELKT